MGTLKVDKIFKDSVLRTSAAKWILGLVGLVFLIAWPLVLNDVNYIIYIATLVFLNSIGAMGLHLIMRVGQVSMGQAAFLGIGGYTSALLTLKFGVPFPIAFFCSGLFSAVAGAVIGPIVLRLRGVYFVLVTFTFGEIMRLVFIEWSSLTGGPQGINEIPSPHPALASTEGYYYLALTAAVICFFFVARFLSCQFGQAMDAIKESEDLAAASGIPVFKYKVLVFVVACALVGFQGSLQAHFVHYISPLAYDFSASINFVIINVIGGMNSLLGPLVGTLFMVSLPELLRSWIEYQWVIYGIVLIAIMVYLPGGLASILANWYRAIFSTRVK